MPKRWSIAVYLSSLLVCCSCHSPATRVHARPLSTVHLSGDAISAMEKWIHAGIGRRAGNIADTGSMKPTLDEHDVVIVEQRPFQQLRAGDIALIDASWTADARVVHRLITQLPIGWWVTCGDANRQPDPLMSERDYAGAVVIAAIEKSTGVVKIFDHHANTHTAIAVLADEPVGGAFKTHIVCSKEF